MHFKYFRDLNHFTQSSVSNSVAAENKDHFLLSLNHFPTQNPCSPQPKGSLHSLQPGPDPQPRQAIYRSVSSCISGSQPPIPLVKKKRKNPNPTQPKPALHSPPTHQSSFTFHLHHCLRPSSPSTHLTSVSTHANKQQTTKHTA